MAVVHGAGAWYVDAYHQGMGRKFNPDTARDTTKMKAYACLSIKNELVYLGYGDKLDTTVYYFGTGTTKAVKEFQRTSGLVVDGAVGRITARKLYESRVFSVEHQFKIPNNYLAKTYALESAFDPGAIGYVDPLDHGLIQINEHFHPEATWQDTADGEYCAIWIGNHYMDAYDTLGDYEAAAVAHNLGIAGAQEWLDGGKQPGTPGSIYLTLLNKQVA